MMSGMRKAPPISTSSPRDTTTSFRCARLLSISSTAAALLFTRVASSAPVISRSQSVTRSSRSPRPPLSRLNSRLAGVVRARTTACTTSSGSSARPRLVCSTVPVRLKTGFRRGAIFWRRAVPIWFTHSASVAGTDAGTFSCLSRHVSRNCASWVRMTFAVQVWPYSSSRGCRPGRRSRASTEGRTVFTAPLLQHPDPVWRRHHHHPPERETGASRPARARTGPWPHRAPGC